MGEKWFDIKEIFPIRLLNLTLITPPALVMPRQ
jgi:hypothetical protein